MLSLVWRFSLGTLPYFIVCMLPQPPLGGGWPSGCEFFLKLFPDHEQGARPI